MRLGEPRLTVPREDPPPTLPTRGEGGSRGGQDKARFVLKNYLRPRELFTALRNFWSSKTFSNSLFTGPSSPPSPPPSFLPYTPHYILFPSLPPSPSAASLTPQPHPSLSASGQRLKKRNKELLYSVTSEPAENYNLLLARPSRPLWTPRAAPRCPFSLQSRGTKRP